MTPLLRFSRWLAVLYGVVLPILETVRRWNNIEYWPAYLDDWFIAAFLLIGAWMTRGGRVHGTGRRVLSAAWGFCCGMGYASFFGHLRAVMQHEPDVGPYSQALVTSLIGGGWVLAIVALLVTLLGGTGEGGRPARDSGGVASVNG